MPLSADECGVTLLFRMQSTAVNSIIGLNVGGKIFQSTRETLLRAGEESFFGILLNGSIPTTKDAQGNYFIDRDPQYKKKKKKNQNISGVLSPRFTS